MKRQANKNKNPFSKHTFIPLFLFACLILSISIPPVLAGQSFRSYYQLDSGEQLQQGMYERQGKQFMISKDLKNNTLVKIDFEKEQEKLKKLLYEKEKRKYEDSKKPANIGEKNKANKKVEVYNSTKKWVNIKNPTMDNNPKYLYEKHYEDYLKERKNNNKNKNQNKENKK